MKQKDITLIIVVAVVGAIVALIVSNLIFGSPAERTQKAEVVDKISADFPTPDKRYFNEKSVDPTETIRIGDGSNQTPFQQEQP